MPGQPALPLPARAMMAGMRVLRHDGPVTAVAVGAAGGREIVVTGGEGPAVRRWDARTGDPLDALDLIADVEGPARDVAVGHGGVFAVTEGGDLCGWDAATGEPVLGWGPLDDYRPAPGGRHGLAVGRHGDTPVLFVADLREIFLLDPSTGRRRGEMLTRAYWGDVYYDNAGRGYADDRPGHESAVCRLVYGELDGRPVLVTSDGSTQYVWDVGGQVRCDLSSDGAGLLDGEALALGRLAGRQVVANASDTSVWLHDAHTGRPAGAPLSGGAVTCLAIESDTLVAGCADGTVRRWPGGDGTPGVAELPGPVTALAVSARTGTVFAAVEDSVHLTR